MHLHNCRSFSRWVLSKKKIMQSHRNSPWTFSLLVVVFALHMFICCIMTGWSSTQEADAAPVSCGAKWLSALVSLQIAAWWLPDRKLIDWLVEPPERPLSRTSDWQVNQPPRTPAVVINCQPYEGKKHKSHSWRDTPWPLWTLQEPSCSAFVTF